MVDVWSLKQSTQIAARFTGRRPLRINKESKVMARPLLAGFLAAFLFSIAGSSSALAARPSDSLLPATTKGYLSVPSVSQLREQFSRSEFGQLINDPAMKPFVDDFKRQLHQQGMKQLEQFGLSWDELDGIPSGEVAVAAIQVSLDEGAIALLVDVTGHAPQAEAQLAKVGDRLIQNGAKRVRRPDGDPLVVYQLPAEPGRKDSAMIVYTLQQNMLLAGDNVAVIEGILRAMTSGRDDSLATLRAYREIMTRCASSAGGLAPSNPLDTPKWYVLRRRYVKSARVPI
jgi:hypothetical protein